jgi:hypothetical protein
MSRAPVPAALAILRGIPDADLAVHMAAWPTLPATILAAV